MINAYQSYELGTEYKFLNNAIDSLGAVMNDLEAYEDVLSLKMKIANKQDFYLEFEGLAEIEATLRRAKTQMNNYKCRLKVFNENNNGEINGDDGIHKGL
jgi:hypothetical protein